MGLFRGRIEKETSRRVDESVAPLVAADAAREPVRDALARVERPPANDRDGDREIGGKDK